MAIDDYHMIAGQGAAERKRTCFSRDNLPGQASNGRFGGTIMVEDAAVGRQSGDIGDQRVARRFPAQHQPLAGE